MKRFFFRKTQRLVSNEQFRSVLAFKCWVQNDLCRMYVRPNTCGYPRMGISVSKSCGNAVLRNRLKRSAREIFRLKQHDIEQNFDYLLIFSHKMSKNKSKDFAQKLVQWGPERVNAAFVDLVSRTTAKAKNRR